MRVGSHHYHVVLDDQGRPTPAALEHEHTVNRGRRHAHYRVYEQMLPELLAAGMAPGEAKALALRLDRTAYTTLDFRRLPDMAPEEPEESIVRRLHPEVRRSLS